MKGKTELFLLLLGLGLFIFDVVSDYLVFIIVPHYVITLVAMNQMKGRFEFNRWYHIVVVFFFFIFVRFKEEFDQWKRTFVDNSPCEEYNNECSCYQCKQHRKALDECRKSAYRFSWIRYVDTYLESTPQWFLQVYIMLKKWSFPWYTVLSATFSLLFLLWSHTALEKTRLANDGHNLSKNAIALYFVSQLLVLVPRLFTIVICMYCFDVSAVFAFLVFSWVIGNFILGCVTCCHALSAVCCGDTRCDCSFTKTLCRKLTLSLLLTFYVSETVLESLGFSSIFIKIVFFLIKSVENIFITAISIYGNSQSLPYPSLFAPLAWSMVATGFFFGSLLLYVRHTGKRREKAVDDANATEPEIRETIV